MTVLIIVFIASFIIASIFFGAFLWSIKNGQYDDEKTPSIRAILDDIKPKK